MLLRPAGDEHPGSIPADMVFVVEEKPHSLFRRDGNDLIMTVVRGQDGCWPPGTEGVVAAAQQRRQCLQSYLLHARRPGAQAACRTTRPHPVRIATLQPLSMADALCGTTLEVKTLDGRKLEVPIQNVVTPGGFKVIR